MLYSINMRNYVRKILALLTVGFLISAAGTAASGQEQEHLRKLDTVRTSMTKIGSSLPDIIRKSEARDIRTLERVFEINNYALVTIESYLKMLKIAVSSSKGIDKSSLDVLNNWLKFISYYCEYDIKYMDEALSQIKDSAIIEVLKSEKSNIAALRDASQMGIKENTAISSKL